jgi:ferredoxin-NADP reductase
MTPLVVREIRNETPSVVSIRLADPDAAPLPPWEPGAHIDLQLITRHERQYSLCGDPADRDAYRIAVRREPLSRGASHYIHSFLRVGGTVWVRPPRNIFALDDAESYLLLSAGIGITPILSMGRALAARGADWRWIHLARTREDVPFADGLAALGPSVTIHISGERGRLDLVSRLRDVAAGTDVSACGPQGFIDELVEVADVLPEGSRVHVERFEPKKRQFRPNEPFSVECARSGVTVTVPAERSMLETLGAAGVVASGSCLRGVCGSCALRVLDGTPEHRDSLNIDDASTTIYPCVSRALSPKLVVDV